MAFHFFLFFLSFPNNFLSLTVKIFLRNFLCLVLAVFLMPLKFYMQYFPLKFNCCVFQPAHGCFACRVLVEIIFYCHKQKKKRLHKTLKKGDLQAFSPRPYFLNCMPNDVTSVRHCLTSFHKKTILYYSPT